MTDTLTLMGILAHPDDESLGIGGTLARYAAEGVVTCLVTATRGERGWNGAPDAYPGLEGLGKIREAELQGATAALGVHKLTWLNYIDGDLDQADPKEAIARIVRPICEYRPQVVITFPHDGAYGHPDHIAISQFTTGAIVCAADKDYTAALGLQPHRVSKLYYMALDRKLGDAYTSAFGQLSMEIDGIARTASAWPDWSITTHIDATAYWERVWQAVACHRSQLPNYDHLAQLTPAEHQQLWGNQSFYRVFSLVNGGRQREHDLFEGLR